MATPAHIHIMLVSEQAAPNLLPALDPAMKPKEAVLLVSKKMANRAEALKAVLQEVGIKVEAVPLPDEHDMAALEGTLLDIAIQRDGKSIALNVTGGNKLMAFAAQAVAQTADWPTFYVDVDTDKIVWLDKTRPSQALTQQLRLRHYLRCASAKRDDALVPHIERVWQANLQIYGADKVWHQMNREDIDVARCTVERLMQRLELQGVRRGPWKTKEAVELATLEWVSWFNHHRLLEPIGYIPSAEAEANYYSQLASQATMVEA